MHPAATPWWHRWWRRSAASPPVASAPELRFGPYLASAVLGQGASGPVFLAQSGAQHMRVLRADGHDEAGTHAKALQQRRYPGKRRHGVNCLARTQDMSIPWKISECLKNSQP